MGLVVFLHYVYFPIPSSSPPQSTIESLCNKNPQLLQRLQLQRNSRSTCSVSSVSTIGGEQMASTKLALKALNLLLKENVIDHAKRSELKMLILSAKPNATAVKAVEEFEMHGDPKRFLQDILSIS